MKNKQIYKKLDIVLSIICLLIPLIHRVILLYTVENSPLKGFAIFFETMIMLPSFCFLILSIALSSTSLYTKNNIVSILSQVFKIIAFLYLLFIGLLGYEIILESIIIYTIIPISGIFIIIVLLKQTNNNQ